MVVPETPFTLVMVLTRDPSGNENAAVPSATELSTIREPVKELPGRLPMRDTCTVELSLVVRVIGPGTAVTVVDVASTMV